MLIILFSYTQISAQSNLSGTVYNDTFPNNEFAINVGSGVPFLFGSVPDKNKYTIRYTRTLKNFNGLRISGNIIIDNTYKKFSSTSGQSNYDLVIQTDTSQLRRYTIVKANPRYFAAIGYEIRRGDNKFTSFYGADLHIGYTYFESSQVDYWFYKDTVYANGLFDMVQSEQPGSYAQVSKTNFLYTSLSPFYGFRYFMNEKFGVSFQMGLGLNAYFGTTEDMDYTTNTKTSRSESIVEFELNGIINDLSIILRF